tara:strand:+ start:343 stop:1641 length:1299 start_codon:yes stop_codon:yes gene_type:complete
MAKHDKKNTEKLKQYLINNPEKLNKDYFNTAQLFGLNYEQVRGVARRLREKITSPSSKEKTTFEENKSGAIVTCEDSKRVKSLDDLLQACKVDLNTWEVDKYDIGTYEVTGFDSNRKPITITMYRTKAWLKRIDPTMNIQKIREELVEDLVPLFDSVPKTAIYPDSFQEDDEHLLEINACDLHIGKIGIDGDEYSIDIARERMINALQHLVKRASGFYINQILFVVGNDFLNSDGDWPVPSTTKGTPQFNTDKHIETYRAGRKLIIECVEMLSEIAPVHIDVIPGNHDRESMMHIGDALEMFYENNENVSVNNDMRMMKAFHYGRCLIINDHGDGPKLNDLPGIVSQRYRDVWSEVRYVEVHRGHYHTNKSYKMQAVEELNGLTVRNLSSMTATDEWHDMKGYVGNIKKASAFVWNKYNGVQAKLNYNVPIN